MADVPPVADWPPEAALRPPVAAVVSLLRPEAVPPLDDEPPEL